MTTIESSFLLMTLNVGTKLFEIKEIYNGTLMEDACFPLYLVFLLFN